MSDQKKAVVAMISVAALAGGVALFLRYKKKNGETVTEDELAEIEVTAEKIADGVAVVPAALAARWSVAAGEKYRPLFDAVEHQFDIPSGLLFRQAYQESHFRDDIISGKTVSKAGATGIMQIIPSLHPEIDPGDAAADQAAARDPAKAIAYAGKFLRTLRNRFGSWELALAAYNAGPGNVSKYGGIPPFDETQKYVAQITADVSTREV